MFRRAALGRTLMIGAAVLAYGAPAAQADEAAAKAVVKSMVDFLAKQTNLHFTYDSDLDVVTDEMQRVTFASSGDVTLSRPNQIHVSRQGGFTDFDLISDGKTATVSANKAGVYLQAAAPGSIDQLIDNLDALGVQSPAADLFVKDAYKELTDPVTSGAVIGTGIIDGKECTHVAFRTATVDWQLWVRTGDEPYPCQYTIVTKHQAQAPEYAVRFASWSAGVVPSADTFSFTPKDGARKVTSDALKGVDELPDLAEGDDS